MGWVRRLPEALVEFSGWVGRKHFGVGPSWIGSFHIGSRVCHLSVASYVGAVEQDVNGEVANGWEEMKRLGQWEEDVGLVYGLDERIWFVLDAVVVFFGSFVAK